MRCSVCQKVIPDASRYCGYCGAATRPARKLPVWWVIALLLLLGAGGGWGLASLRPTPPIIVYVTATPAGAIPPKASEPTKAPEPTKALTPTKAPEPTRGPSPTPIPMPTGIATQVSITDGMTLLYVPAGEFTVGSADSDSDAESDEKPQHKVALDAYWIDRTEVTNAQYRKCVAAGACQPPSKSSSSTRSSYYGNAEYDNYPVLYVSWEAAQKYCQWAGRRLPTEAEWEKAARGTDGRIYPWGNAAPDNQRANFNGNKGDTTAVGSYPSGASPYGALDMAGNVWEWTADWYNETYYQSAPAQNPKGPDSGQYRVLRGGSWNYGQWGVRAAARIRDVPGVVIFGVGFRCARS